MRAYVIREDGTHGAVEIGNKDIDDGVHYNEIIDCDMIDMVRRTVGNRAYTMVVDDEGLLKDRTPRAAWVKFGQLVEMLVGTIVIVSVPDGEGWCHGLSDDDVDNIASHVTEGILAYKG